MQYTVVIVVIARRPATLSHVISLELRRPVLRLGLNALGMVNVVEVSCRLWTHILSHRESFLPPVAEVIAARAQNV